MKCPLPNTLTFPQRKLKKNYRSITGHFPSIKNNKSIAFESKLESELFLTLEFDDDIESYMEQPLITITVDGKEKSYHVDCYAKMKESSPKKDLLIEAKYTHEIEKEREYFEKKFKAANIAAKKLDIDFVVYNELIHSQKYIYNLDFLYRYKTQPIVGDYDQQIFETLKHQPLTAQKVVEKLSEKKLEQFQIANAIWSLVADRKLSTDLEQDLNMDSIIEVVL